mmetsp:Transcript_24062/g.58104  ORF Transcript_24062/g.58104 Transcript_24062/m.58104 type:complete len:93 (-) Transcript_24062:74-352(-)
MVDNTVNSRRFAATLGNNLVSRRVDGQFYLEAINPKIRSADTHVSPLSVEGSMQHEQRVERKDTDDRAAWRVDEWDWRQWKRERAVEVEEQK